MSQTSVFGGNLATTALNVVKKRKEKTSTLSNLVIGFCPLMSWHETAVMWSNHQKMVTAQQEWLGLNRCKGVFEKLGCTRALLDLAEPGLQEPKGGRNIVCYWPRNEHLCGRHPGRHALPDWAPFYNYSTQKRCYFWIHTNLDLKESSRMLNCGLPRVNSFWDLFFPAPPSVKFT